MSHDRKLHVLEKGTRIKYIERIDKLHDNLNIHIRESRIEKLVDRHNIRLENGDNIDYFQIRQFNNEYSYYYLSGYGYMDYLHYDFEECRKKLLKTYI